MSVWIYNVCLLNICRVYLCKREIAVEIRTNDYRMIRKVTRLERCRPVAAVEVS